MRFSYLRDPLFLFAVVAYVLNREVLKPYLGWSFFRDYLNDCICIPFWVPITVWITRLARLRPHDGPPRAGEILIPLILWSIAFEIVLPLQPAFHGVAIADPVDVLCYCAGAGIGAWYWDRRYSD